MVNLVKKIATVEDEVNIERRVNRVVGFDLMRGQYMVFAKEIKKLMRKHKGANLITEIAIKELKWERRGLNSVVLFQIERLFGEFVFKFDEGRLDLCVLG